MSVEALGAQNPPFASPTKRSAPRLGKLSNFAWLRPLTTRCSSLEHFWNGSLFGGVRRISFDKRRSRKEAESEAGEVPFAKQSFSSLVKLPAGQTNAMSRAAKDTTSPSISEGFRLGLKSTVGLVIGELLSLHPLVLGENFAMATIC